MTAPAPEATTPYRSPRAPGRDGFLPLLHAEFTKFRTVRGWVVGLVVAAVVTVAVGLLGAAGTTIACGGPHGGSCDHSSPTGPGGVEVRDALTLVHRPLTGDGSITARITSLTGRYAPEGTSDPAAGGSGLASGVQPWAKAGVIVKAGTTPGSSYAAVALTGAHGIRLQYDYTHDAAGLPGEVTADSPRWLRLTRSGDTLTGYDSADGTRWTRIGAARLPGLPATVQIGLFSTSPEHLVTSRSMGSTSVNGGPSTATAAFDSVTVQGTAGGGWTGDTVGAEEGPDKDTDLGYRQSGETFTLTGSGDIGPLVRGRDEPGRSVEDTLIGVFAGLVVVTVVAAMSVTAEYRRGLIRTTFTAAPRRGRVLAAKAAVTGGLCFAAGLAGTLLAVSLVKAVEKHKHFPLHHVPAGTELRIVLGTAGLFAVTGVLALAVGTLLRRSAGAVTAVVVAIVVPYILAVSGMLPPGPSRWLARVTPAAAFAVQQSAHQYTQVTADYSPANGYFPLAPWAGFAVLCGYAAVAAALAAVRLRRRDA